jgi:hypothetical protein
VNNNFQIIQKSNKLYEHIEELQAITEIKKPLQEKDYFRASAIFKMCPREEALYHKYNIDRKDRISAALWRTFSFGRVFERFFRDELLGKSQILVGIWKCNICEFCTDKHVRISKPSECGVCGAQSFEYVEEDLINEELGIGGHPDGFLKWDNEEYLLELKTTNSFNFSKILTEPMASHIAQMQIYMHILKLGKGIVFYFNKDTSQIILHEISYSEEQVKILFEKPMQYKSYLKTANLPPRICFDASNARANKCAMCKLCFKES